MAPKSDLVNIGKEGFALIDECFGRRRRPSHHVLPPPPAAATAATTFRANHPQICYQPQESYVVYQPQESSTVRVNKAFATEATQPQESYLVYQTQPQESYLVYQPQESKTVRVNKAFAAEATVVSVYQYDASAKSVESMRVMDYQRPPFHMRYN